LGGKSRGAQQVNKRLFFLKKNQPFFIFIFSKRQTPNLFKDYLGISSIDSANGTGVVSSRRSRTSPGFTFSLPVLGRWRSSRWCGGRPVTKISISPKHSELIAVSYGSQRNDENQM
jgi:hypothetical protein